jgi:phosphoribosylaminoimidazole carboxylase (NCAIR synthetase)
MPGAPVLLKTRREGYDGKGQMPGSSMRPTPRRPSRSWAAGR